MTDRNHLDNLRRLLDWCKGDPRRLAWLINDLRRPKAPPKGEGKP